MEFRTICTGCGESIAFELLIKLESTAIFWMACETCDETSMLVLEMSEG